MADQAEVIAAARQMMAKDVFAQSLGIEMVELRPGYCRTGVTISPRMLNGYGVPHGGLLFALADYAFAGACNSHGRVALALNVSINYLSAAAVGTRLYAEAQEEHLTRRTGVYRITIMDGAGGLVASCSALAYRKDEWFAGGPEDANTSRT
jgi:acyl-CoA thioesterase